MPQMSPLQWELLFIFTLLALVLLMVKTFFSWMGSPQKSPKDIPSLPGQTFNWPW